MVDESPAAALAGRVNPRALCAKIIAISLRVFETLLSISFIGLRLGTTPDTASAWSKEAGAAVRGPAR
ncbi:hypothetical protein [Methylobacterium oryzisoli]|uniref:hypothetical protein n=1 Tax=Methylobacterium oryzisoli TaxID=3385502 RepID=UPI003891E012